MLLSRSNLNQVELLILSVRYRRLLSDSEVDLTRSIVAHLIASSKLLIVGLWLVVLILIRLLLLLLLRLLLIGLIYIHWFLDCLSVKLLVLDWLRLLAVHRLILIDVLNQLTLLSIDRSRVRRYDARLELLLLLLWVLLLHAARRVQSTLIGHWPDVNRGVRWHFGELVGGRE